MIAALLAAIRARRERHGNCPVTLDLLESIVLEAVNPVDFSYKTPAPVIQLRVPPEYPKLKVRCDAAGQVVEERILYSREEESALRKEAARNQESWFQQAIERAAKTLQVKE